ncbi:hypothetical protein ACYSNU_03615 [Enterococcus sp. LJL120]
MNETYLDSFQKAIEKLDEICQRLEHIEENTHLLDNRQKELDSAVIQLRRVVGNDNIIG